MADNIKFTPIRGKQAKIDQLPIVDGHVYFATDTGRIFTDTSRGRILLGNNGVALFYANDPSPIQLTETEEEGTLFSLAKTYVEGIENCHVNDLVLNKPDGCFYQIITINSETISCAQLAVSGSGGGGGGGGSSSTAITLSIENIGYLGYIYAYHQNYDIKFTPKTELADYVALRFDVQVEGSDEWVNIQQVARWRQNTAYTLNAALFPLADNFSLRVRIAADAEQKVFTFNELSTVEVTLAKGAQSYTPLIMPSDATGRLDLTYIPHSDESIATQLHVYIDDVEDLSYLTTLGGGDYDSTNHVYIERQSHGTHKIELALSAVINNSTIYTGRVEYSGAWATAGNDTPIVWLGNYDSTVINYENSYIQFMVFDPIAYNNGLPANISLYKNNLLVSEMSLNYSALGWAEWDISAIYDVGNNTFSIVCRGAKQDIPVFVTEEGSRQLGLKETGSLLANFSAAGRSNLEIKSTRTAWNGTDGQGNTISATLSGFNWQNNGWAKDTVVADTIDNGAYLSLTNGASVSFPCPSLTLNNSINYTIEARFRVRNVQKYSTLVSNIPKYFYNTGTALEPEKSSTSETMAWITDHGYTVFYDDYGSPLMDEEHTEHFIETENGVICKWINEGGNGLVLGSQEAYFRSPESIINVRYKEDEVINISCVISKTDGLAYIYLNGILSGANKLPANTSFAINSPFVFNSDYCDVDLYRFRIYNTGLSMPAIIHNYLSDIHSIALYDQNQLTEANTPTLLSYNLLTKYNEDHPDDPTMPYAVWEILSDNELLPGRKGNNLNSVITFVNPALDRALETGEIDEWYYYTHCPSYKAYYVDINVQGTSSQIYPRRNFKTKFKPTTDAEHGGYWVYTKGSLADESLNEEHTVLDKNGVEHTLSKSFHMDNEYVGTNKFTWKIDYMESSGTYNTGFANLLGNQEEPLYTKHPLADIGISANGLRTSVYGFPVLIFHKFNTKSHNYSFPGKEYDFIGRYNMNLDKGSNEYYGFDSKAKQTYIEGTPSIKSIAECWELKDNQGDWCSFKFPSAEARASGFGTSQTGLPNRLEMIKHFEYRYSAYGDQIDAIGATGDYDGTTDDPDIAAEIGADDAAKSVYLRKKYFNLERLFFWLDSTDQTAATNGDIVIYTPEQDANGVVSVSSATVGSVDLHTMTDYTGELGATSVADPVSGYTTTFTKDTAIYRKEKFRNEFEQHFDKEYCLVYFVLTELLLCYDSRGKNMMLASFGPHALNGEFVWYPIFYDIDTQLGLNNSGAYLWDYDADVTADGLFSTPKSVLWTNFYDVFEGDIKNKYRVLRGIAGNNSPVQGNLTYTNITGAYECNGNVFNSYAMRGIRPIIAIGLDAYYKYIAPAITGYQSQGDANVANITVQDTPIYAYCAQGDKKLTTELLLKNRLNYIDSWWLAGEYDYSVVAQYVYTRINANKASETSDKFLDSASLSEAPNGFSLAAYPVPYFDGRPGYCLKPFLKQYITYYVDGTAVPPKKYNGENEGLWTNVTGETPFKTTVGAPSQQINYIPATDYLSSLGDLSLAYLDSLTIGKGAKLLDLNIGSDVPGYENQLLNSSTTFTLNDGLTSEQPKSLLKSIVLSNLSRFDIGLDIRASKKLQEFRALNTLLPSVTFADGAPLHTVHLPATVTTLSFIENSELTDILTTEPKAAKWVDNETSAEVAFAQIQDFNDVHLERTDASAYRGLYIKNITDYVPAMANNGHEVSKLEIEGGGLGYNSYTLLKNLYDLKAQALTKNRLAISLKEVHWTPYTAVETGEAYNSNFTYYLATDHSNFVEYTYTTAAQWETDTLNGVVFTKDENVDTTAITNLGLLSAFIGLYQQAMALPEPVANQFTNTTGASTPTMPTITGDIFVDNTNGTAINEEDLTEYYKVYYPSLTIRAANINPANITKYVQILDTGRTEVIETLRSTSEHPLAPTAAIPLRANYDFCGWSLTPNGALFLEYDNATQEYIDAESALEEYTFSAGNDILTLYAKFEQHKYDVIIYDGDNNVLRLDVDNPVYNYDGDEVTALVTVGTAIGEITKIPYKPAAANDFLGVYEFIGYSLHGGNGDLIDLSTYVVNRNVAFDSNFSYNSNVRAVDFSDLFDVTNFTYTDSQYITVPGAANANYNADGWLLTPKNPDGLRGKITIPNTFTKNGVTKEVIAIDGFHMTSATSNVTTSDSALTHVFLEDPTSCSLRLIRYGCFNACNALVYFDFPASSLRVVDGIAFRSCALMPAADDASQTLSLGNNLGYVGDAAFNNGIGNYTSPQINLNIGYSIAILRSMSFAYLNLSGSTLLIGNSSNSAPLRFAQPYTGSVENPTMNVANMWFPQNADNHWAHVEGYLQCSSTAQGINNNFNYTGSWSTQEFEEAFSSGVQFYSQFEQIFGIGSNTSYMFNVGGTVHQS